MTVENPTLSPSHLGETTPRREVSLAGSQAMAAAPPLPPPVSNIISGRIIHKETGEGIPNLQVDLLDLDDWPDPEFPIILGPAPAIGPVPPPPDISALYRMVDRIGSVITDTSGNIRFEVIPNDFNLPGKQIEQKPDLVLVVLAPDEPGLDINARLLHLAMCTPAPIRDREAVASRYSLRLG